MPQILTAQLFDTAFVKPTDYFRKNRLTFLPLRMKPTVRGFQLLV
jgi:hypothetical protein